MDFHAIEAGGFHSVECGGPVGVDDFGQLFGFERSGLGSRHEGGDAVPDQHGFGFGGNGRRRHRLAPIRLQLVVRHPAHVPELHHDFAAFVMHRFGDVLPPVELLGAIQARHIGITLGLMADGRGFGDQQAGRGALAVVLSHQRGRNGVGCAVAR